MIKLIKILSVFCVMVYLSGCASTVISDIPLSNNQNIVNIRDKDRKKITFSISYASDINEIYGKEVTENLKKKISKKLSESNLFKKVRYTENPENFEKMHYHFNVVLSGSNTFQKELNTIVALSTMMIVPTAEYYGIDISMHVTKNNNEIYSISAPQRIKDVFWLPYIFLSPFKNHSTAKTKIEDNALDYFLDEIVRERLY